MESDLSSLWYRYKLILRWSKFTKVLLEGYILRPTDATATTSTLDTSSTSERCTPPSLRLWDANRGLIGFDFGSESCKNLLWRDIRAELCYGLRLQVQLRLLRCHIIYPCHRLGFYANPVCYGFYAKADPQSARVLCKSWSKSILYILRFEYENRQSLLCGLGYTTTDEREAFPQSASMPFFEGLIGFFSFFEGPRMHGNRLRGRAFCRDTRVLRDPRECILKCKLSDWLIQRGVVSRSGKAGDEAVRFLNIIKNII